MLISHRKKFIYAKTVKTAGTSVESYFEKYCMAKEKWVFAHHRDQQVTEDGIIGARGPEAGNSEWFNHMPAFEIRDKIGTPIWNRYFKFTVVRNPFDKLVSMFYFRKEKGLLNIENNSEPIKEFRKWIREGVVVPDRDQYLIDGHICIDYFIRYEDIDNGIKYVCEKLGLPFDSKKIPKLKSGIRDRSIPLDDYYSEDIKRFVYEAYEFEMKEFGYSFPS